MASPDVSDIEFPLDYVDYATAFGSGALYWTSNEYGHTRRSSKAPSISSEVKKEYQETENDREEAESRSRKEK